MILQNRSQRWLLFLSPVSISTLRRLLRHLHSSDTKAYLHFKLYATEMLVYSPLLSLSLFYSLSLGFSFISAFRTCSASCKAIPHMQVLYEYMYIYIQYIYVCLEGVNWRQIKRVVYRMRSLSVRVIAHRLRSL